MTALQSGRVIMPPRTALDRGRPSLEPGERVVLEFFDRNLAPEWEIYVQPHLNGLRPDFVLLHPHVGIGVFEVKNWNLDAIEYRVEPAPRGAPRLICRGPNGTFVRISPVEKVELYRKEIGRLYCPRLDRTSDLAAVTGGLIFPSAPREAVERLLAPAVEHRARANGHRRYLPVAGADDLEADALERVFPEALRRHSSIMTPDLASDLRHWLVEPDFAAEQRQLPALTQRQRLAITSRTPTGARRIRGPAGSGKTLVLAGRAAALASDGKHVLVVTYNRTLLHYLRDLVVCFGCDSRRITFLNFHEWCRRTMEQAGCADEYRALWRGGSEDEVARDVLEVALPRATADSLRAAPAGAVPSYDAILVDEGQDMLPEWWNVLRQVVRPDGERVLVADTAQDIYGRGPRWTDVAMRGAGFPGAWLELDVCHRMPTRLTELAREFVAKYIRDPDALPPAPAQQELDVDAAALRWVQVRPEAFAEACVEAIRAMVAASGALPDERTLAFADVVFICDRHTDGQAVTNLLAAKNINVLETFSADDRTRRRKQHAFFKGDARIKGTTVHSFKGWEGRAIVVGVRGANSPEAKRLLYTGMTRLKAHRHGSYLTVVCAESGLAQFGRLWPSFDES